MDAVPSMRVVRQGYASGSLGGKPLQPNARHATVPDPKRVVCVSVLTPCQPGNINDSGFDLAIVGCLHCFSRALRYIFCHGTWLERFASPVQSASPTHFTNPLHKLPFGSQLPGWVSWPSGTHPDSNLQRLHQSQPGRRCPLSPGSCDGRTW